MWMGRWRSEGVVVVVEPQKGRGNPMVALNIRTIGVAMVFRV